MKFKSQHYQVAYRRVKSDFNKFPLTADNENAFCLIPNTLRYWAADPFLYAYDGTLYLFAELYDFVNRKGVIGYCVWKNNRFTKWKPIIDEPFHMSYPLVFSSNGYVYMIPETHQANELILYKAVDFPYKWKREKTLLQDCRLVDTTVTPKMGGGYNGFALSKDGLCALIIDENLNVKDFTTLKSADAATNRNGGNMIHKNGKIIRPCQDCTKEYGYSLIFRELDQSTMEETDVYNLNIKDVRVNNSAGKPIQIYGLHTYNKVGDVEVIDIKRNNKIHPIEVFWRLINKVQGGL